jgi:TonB family protein
MSARRAALAAALIAAALARAACQSQGASEGAWGDRFRSGDDTESALPSLTQAALEDFESPIAPAWMPSMPISDGVVESKIASTAGTESGRALGVRVLFMRRALSTLDLRPPAPIRIDGRCVSLSVRAYGTGFPHELSLLVLDYYGAEHELSLGRLDFRGWRRLEASIPLLERGGSAYVQDDPHFRDPAGLRVSGIRIAFDLEESYGQYVAYFDDLGALVDAASVGSAAPIAEADGKESRAAMAEAGPRAPISRSAEDTAAEDTAAEGAAASASKAHALVLGEIERRIAASMSYPEAARLRGIEGSIVLAFRVDKGGALVSARIVKGSGSEILDRAGVDLLRSAFPVVNDSGLDLDLEIPITFRLDGSRRD